MMKPMIPSTASAPARVASAGQEPPPPPGVQDPLTRARPGHLWQIDVVRLLTFSAVIWVHALAFTEQPNDPVAAGAMMLLQYGREVFFALTGFVLVYSTAGRPLRLGSFWKKRVLYVAVPYVTWSAIYYAYTVLGPAHASPSVGAFASDLLYGGAMYHLYFLLVTIQLYLAFPLIRRFVHRTADRWLPVLVGVGMVNLAWLGIMQYVKAPSSGVGLWVFQHAYELLPTYSVYVLAGCYAAVHLERVQKVVRERSRFLFGVAALAAVGALAVYAAQLPVMEPRVANSVTQPGMVLSCVAAAILVYLVGVRWAEGPRRHQRLVESLSDASFGLYLAHPLVLALLLDYAGFGNNNQQLPSALATVLAFVISAAGGTAIALVFRRTPLSLAVTGRPWRAEVKRQPALQPALQLITAPSLEGAAAS